ncbi:MAG TPA: carbon-nitrogen hydrolase family protein [Chloroflexia bacterium]|nr:carbon-nitrogen hydrolase family protein [Chloroflexia bacterium]
MSIKIASLQLRAFELGEARAALDHAISMIEQAVEEHHPDLIVTPECTYPAYVLGSAQEFSQNYPGDPLPRLSDLARKHQIHLCVGLATPAESEGGPVIYNEAVLLGPDGSLIGRTAKSLLWHFDTRWFCPGASYPVFETALGRIGMLVCADGRQPEIARSLALAGAQIILDPTCWVTSGSDRRDLHNQQADYMLAARAWENGVWCVASDKVGLERGTVLYAGRSSIIGPDGKKVAEGPSDSEAVVVAEIPDLKPRSLSPAPRRPALYSNLSRTTEELPVHALLQEPLIPSRAQLRAAVAQYPPFTSTQEMGEVVRPLIAQLARENVELVVLPDVTPNVAEEAAWRSDLVFPFYRSLSKLSGVAILATAVEQEGHRRYKTACLFAQGQEIGLWRQAHFTPQDEGRWTPSAEIGPVVKFPGQSGTRLSVMLGADGFGSETARSLMLNGADVILWPVRASLPGSAGFDLSHLARTRAAENRVYILCSTPLEEASGLAGGTYQGRSLIADPNGVVVAPALPDTAMAVSAQLSISSCREKLRVPGTDVVYSRRPDLYGLLVKEDGVEL